MMGTVASARVVLLVAAVIAAATAFRPLALQRRASFTGLSAGKTSLHEFDHLLVEGQQGAMPTRNRRVAVASGDHRTTLLTSLAAPPVQGEAIAEELEQMSSEAEQSTQIEAEDDPYASAWEAQQSKIQQYQEKQQPGNKLKEMDFQDIVLTFILPSVALFAAGRWGYNRVSERVVSNMDTVLDSFAREMIFHDGDLDEMAMCYKDFSKRLVYLGPLKTDKMLKGYLQQYSKRKTVSPQAISSLSYVFSLFNLSEEAAAKVLVSLCRDMGTDKISSAGKLLFLGSRILKSPQGTAGLLPIKELIKSTYREEAVAETMIDTSQQ
jgi:hypothetical protein